LKAELEELLRQALHKLPPGTLPAALESTAGSRVSVERTRDAGHGDFACNIALRLAKEAGLKPRELAELIVKALPANALIARTEVAGAGFINLYLVRGAHGEVLRSVLERGERYGEGSAGAGRSVCVEFVSANPTGPLHVGHGRQAAYGASLANLLEVTGHRVHREYYINDAGRQVDILTASAWVRYLQSLGETLPFPENGYRADYVNAIGDALRGAHGEALRFPASKVLQGLPADAPVGDKEQYIDALISRMRELLGNAHYESVQDLSLAAMLADIREDLAEFGVHFDTWSSERALARAGAVERTLEKLTALGHTYTKDGALWLKTSAFGDSEDRVLVRANGQKTYFAPDIAYHMDKRARGFELLLDVWGADHHGYIPRMRAGLMALGEKGECLEVSLMQFVSLYRGDEKVPMGKRDGQFVTLRQLRTEVGNDECRLFYLMRSHDQPLDFDLELAKSRSNDNPVYYMQYAHARVASVMKQLSARGLSYDAKDALAQLDKLDSPHEAVVLTALGRYPEILEQAAMQRAPHTLVHFLRELAQAFHTWYNASQFIVDEPATRNARLALALGVQQVMRNGLKLLGASAPESM